MGGGGRALAARTCSLAAQPDGRMGLVELVGLVECLEVAEWVMVAAAE